DLHDTRNKRPYSIEIQTFVFKDAPLQPEIKRGIVKQITKHLDDLISCFGAKNDKIYDIGYRCSIVPFSDSESHIVPENAEE
ncbi:hypothetical protein MHBO_004763, partial [Bonamia ostreae]